MIQPDIEIVEMARELRSRLAGDSLPRPFAKLYSQHTRLHANQTGLHWQETETVDRLEDALHLLEAAFIEREAGGNAWRNSVRRAAELLEWLSHPQLNVNGLPIHLLAAASYQFAGYPARASGLLDMNSVENDESKILQDLLKGELTHLQRELARYWARVVLEQREEKKEGSIEGQLEDLNSMTQKKVLKDIASSLGILCATLRWGNEPRLDKALTKFTFVEKILLYGTDSYSWLLSKLCIEVAHIYVTSSLRFQVQTLAHTMSDNGSLALERYLRQYYFSNKTFAWPSQTRGIEQLSSLESFALCTPTGSGKTTVAELAILQSLFPYRKTTTAFSQDVVPLVIYLVPSRALATEVELKLSKVLRDLDVSIIVTGLYGGTDWGPTDAWLTAENQTVLICTYEKGEALIRFLGPLFLKRISLVVVDEAHSIQFDENKQTLQKAENRSLRLEMLGARLFYSLEQNHGRVIALSAVATGMESALAKWATGRAEASPAQTYYRSVRQLIGRLEYSQDNHFAIKYDLLDGASLEYETENLEDTPYIPRPFDPLPRSDVYKKGKEVSVRPYLFWAAIHLAKQDEAGKQHTVLISITQNISGYAQDFVQLLEEVWVGFDNLPIFFQEPQDLEKKELWEKCLRSCEDYFGKTSREYRLLEKGIVVHHGKMPGLMARLLIEVIREQIVYIVIATSTLSEGVNLPFETILIPSLERRTQSGYQEMSVHEFSNLAGRSGRPGYGTEGRCLVLLESSLSAKYQSGNQIYGRLINGMISRNENIVDTRSPLAALLIHLERQWSWVSENMKHNSFLQWLEQAAPLEIEEEIGSQEKLQAFETLDTLDSILLNAIVEVEQISQEDLEASELELQLRRIWQRSYAYYASSEENRLANIFIRRGHSLRSTIYPDAVKRKQLYKTGLPPRSGNQLINYYPAIKKHLITGRDYAFRSPSERVDYIQLLVKLLTSLPKYKLREKIRNSKIDWQVVLSWWLRRDYKLEKKPTDMSLWHQYVSESFVYRINWGIGSIIALAGDETFGNSLIEPSLTNWHLLDLPWIVLWLKELITWGTTEPVAAHLLANRMEITRADAENAATGYYATYKEQFDENEILNPGHIRDWANLRYGQKQRLQKLSAPDRIDVNLLRDFSRAKTNKWRVVPVVVDNDIYWFDSAGFKLAVCSKPYIWEESFIHTYDFLLDSKRKVVFSGLYTQQEITID